MARFISVARSNISNNSASPTAIITGATNSSGVPSSTYGVVLSILASNKNANSQNVTVQLIKGGSTTTSLITSGQIPSKSSLEFMEGNKLVIEPGDWIKAYSTTASAIDIVVSYMLNNQDNSI
ncbi:MAG: hypothetical protein CMB76_02930 [Euryarchaeota archaeon]|nr:hypothetical protein [Euryarchaeota archaeon]|tara:strand:+ start:329 stop:697 length:369 start_codon:yes stop_codon:yes gene_type:complete